LPIDTLLKSYLKFQICRHSNQQLTKVSRNIHCTGLPREKRSK